MLDRSYAETQRRAWQRQQAWQHWWREDRTSTLNAVVANAQQPGDSSVASERYRWQHARCSGPRPNTSQTCLACNSTCMPQTHAGRLGRAVTLLKYSLRVPDAHTYDPCTQYGNPLRYPKQVPQTVPPSHAGAAALAAQQPAAAGTHSPLQAAAVAPEAATSRTLQIQQAGAGHWPACCCGAQAARLAAPATAPPVP